MGIDMDEARMRARRKALEYAQKKRMDLIFSNREVSPTTADADFCGPNDSIEPEPTPDTLPSKSEH